jgi:ATP-dependent helicase/nuclease subunit A
MAREWLAIEERVPGPDGAVERHVGIGPPGGPSRLVKVIAEAISREPRSPTWLVAPSRRVARQWIDTIALAGTPVFNLRSTNPRALCYDLAASSLALAGLSVASPRAAVVLVEKVIVKADRSGSLAYFASPRSYRRLAERMLASLAAMRMAGLTAESILRRDGFGGSAKGRDLALLLRAYAAELAAAKLVDAADIAGFALTAVKSGVVSTEWRRILLPEGTQLQPLERQVFEALGERVSELAIDPEPQAFGDPSRGPTPKFFRAIGEVNEIRGVLRRCLAGGIPLDTVEFLHTDASTYPSLVQEVFATMAEDVEGPQGPSEELPVTFAEGLPIRESRPARALLAWLAWRAERHPQWRLVRMLRDGLIDWSGERDAVITPPKVIRELRRLRIGFDLAATADKVRSAIAAVEAAPLSSFVAGSRDPDDDVEFDEEAARRWRADRLAALGVLAKLATQLVECEPAADANARGIVAGARRFLEEVAASKSQFDNNAKNRLLAEVAEMERWLAIHPDASAVEILDWLAGLADTLVVMGSGPRPGCLHVASITTGGHSGRPHTFIVGLDENRFPGPGSSDPVLPDADRAALSEKLDLAAGATAKARTEFWRLLGRLRGEVHLSYSCRDLVEQSEVFPSPLLLEVYRRQAGVPQATLAEFVAAIAPATESFVAESADTALTRQEWWLATLGEDPSPAAVHQAIHSHGESLARGLEAEEARRSPRFTPWDGLVPAAGAELDPTNPSGRVASAHSLESLGACPRRFFFHYGLGIKPPEALEPEEDRWLDHMEHGSVLHAVLERFMRAFLHEGPGRPAVDAPRPTFAEHETTILGILDDVLEAKRAEKPTNDEVAVAAGRRELASAVRTFLRAEEEYSAKTGSLPVALEAAIGFVPHREAETFDRSDPVVMPLSPGRTIRLRGFVDRIDIDGREDAENGYVVIDYKKGRSARFKHRSTERNPLGVFQAGRRLQHGLYVMMVRHVAREAVGGAARVTQFAYVFPGADTLGERVAWTAEELEGVVAVVESLCGIAAAGTFLATSDPQECGFCDFREVCGDASETVRSARRKLRHDEGRYGPESKTLGELFDGLRNVKEPAAAPPFAAGEPRPFEQVAEEQPGPLGDAAAREQIRTVLDASMLVEASAGTGKTTCMVDRMTALIRSGTATVGQIAATTFTKKAAAELARRFRERLERDAADSGASEEERRRMLAALAEIDSAVIGTVHSFCGRLLRERPIEAGLDPAFESMDAAGEQTLRGRAWREFCERATREESLLAFRAALEAAGIDLRDLRPAFETFVAHGDVEHWPHDPVDPPKIEPLVEELCGEIEARLEGVLVSWSARGDDKLMNAMETVVRAWRTRSDDSPASAFKAIERLEGSCPKVVQSLWLPGGRDRAHQERQRERKAELERWWVELVDRVREPLERWRAHRYQFVIPLLTAAREHYERLRLAEGQVSFHDLLSRTARLLRERPEVRVGFAARHPFLLVDEFQDTDPLQAEILLLLTADDPHATDWRSTRVKPGSLFVVGDPKQSIYRFRRADIDTFEFVKERIRDSGGRFLQLTTNFRTNRELVEWVNAEFADRFETHRGGAGDPTVCGPGFAPSEVGRTTAVAGCLSGLRQLRVRSRQVNAEAEAVARFIRRAIDHGLTVPRSDAREPAACRPEDFMIVTWDTGRLSDYADALNAVGLPCDVTGRKGCDSREDLAMLGLCLRVVADPEDAVAALAVLRGPVFGWSDAELHVFRRAGGAIDGRMKLPADIDVDRGVAARATAAAEKFRRWRRLAGSLPLAAAIERIADDAGLLLVASEAGGRAGRRGRAAAGAIATFVERVRAERSLLTSVQDVIERLEDLVAEEFPKQDFDTASIDATMGGAVRVMNLHKVKGLEAPVVFLCDEDGPKRDRSPSWHVSRSVGEPRGYLKVSRAGPFGKDGTTLAAPLGWRDVEAMERRYLEAEYLRLNYVAGTRPGTCLVASVFDNADGAVVGGWHELSPEIQNVANLPDLEPAAGVEAARAAAAARPLADAAAISSARHAAAASVAAVRRATFGTVTPRDFLTEPAERIRHTGRGLGQDWGTVIHRLLELAAQAPASFDLEAAAESAIAESDLVESEAGRTKLVGRAVSLVRDVLRSDVWRRIEASSARHVEVPFSIAVTAAEIPTGVEVDHGPGAGDAACAEVLVLVRGQIDAVYRDESSPPPAGMSDWVIVDWKTTSVTEADAARLEDHYRPQLQLYARAWASEQ